MVAKKIDLETYQEKMQEVSRHYGVVEGGQLPTFAMGVSEECGEVLGLLKLHFRGDGFELDKLKEEAGDLVAYLTLLLNHFGLSLEDVLAYNVEKLDKRVAARYEDKEYPEAGDMWGRPAEIARIMNLISASDSITGFALDQYVSNRAKAMGLHRRERNVHNLNFWVYWDCTKLRSLIREFVNSSQLI